jgi:hypothetical protein
VKTICPLSVLLLLIQGCGTGGSAKSFTDTAQPDDTMADTTPPETCEPESKVCEGAIIVECTGTGVVASRTPCPDDSVCIQGACEPCKGGTSKCFQERRLACDEHGQTYTLTECDADQYCINGFCVVCHPGTTTCAGDLVNEVWRCADDGSAMLFDETCPVGTLCEAGFCRDPCSEDIKSGASVGCEYFAVDLENADTGGYAVKAEDAQFAVVVSNPDPALPVEVTVYETVGGPLVGSPVTIPPKNLHVFHLPPRNIKGSMRGPLAWHVTGTRPFVAHQFNPLDNINPVYSNDASLLFPARVAGTSYLAVTGKHNAFVTVIGIKADTQVTITPSADIEASVDSSIPSIGANTSWTTTIGPGEVVNLRSQLAQNDLTGTEIASSKPVVVFAGNQGTFAKDRCCADHLEQQQTPLSTWGKTVVVGRSKARGIAPDHWRILASEDQTTITLEPSSVAPAQTLDRGEFIQITSNEDFVVTADQPIQVAQLLAGSHEVTVDGAGCQTDLDCTSTQQCVIWLEGKPGQCHSSCQVQQDDCPDAAEQCHERSWVFSSVLSPGDGFCYRQICSTGEPDSGCAAEGICKDDLCYTPCSQTCAEPGATCNPLTGCEPLQCGTGLVTCPVGSLCDGLGQPVECRRLCTPSNQCPDTGFKCLDQRWAQLSPFNGGVCIRPNCKQHADCPAGHGCKMTNDLIGVCEPIGDPALILWPPVTQWRQRYVFLTPQAYRLNYVTVVVNDQTQLTIDGETIDASVFKPIGASNYQAARFALEPGVHTLVGSAPVGVAVYGFDDDVSYGYPGGSLLSDQGP